MALDEAASALNVSVQALERRIRRGELPEATRGDDGYTVDADALADIADREGWIIDLRDDADAQDPALTDVLEKVLSLGDQLTQEVAARKVAEQTVEIQAGELEVKERQLVELEGVIEELDAETSRVAADLHQAQVDLAVAEALVSERAETIADLRADAKAAQRKHDQIVREQRRQATQLRQQLQDAYGAMGWFSRRRLERKG